MKGLTKWHVHLGYQIRPRSYEQLVEPHRDDAGRPMQRTVATLGRFDQMGDSVRSLHDCLSSLLGLETTQASSNGTAAFESSRALGAIWALTRLWESSGLHRPGGCVPAGKPPPAAILKPCCG